MGTVYRKKRGGKPYGFYIAKFRDAQGFVTTRTTGCRGRAAAQSKLSEFERHAERQRCGLLSPQESEAAGHAGVCLTEHLESYLAALERRGVTARHVKARRAEIGRVLNECRFRVLADLDRTRFERWLHDRAQEGLGARRRNVFRTALGAFARWGVETGRLLSNPFDGIKAAPEAADKRHVRRALSPDDLERLFAAAEARPLQEVLTVRVGPNKGAMKADVRPAVQERARLLGIERALTWRFMAFTGARFNEARMLTVGNVVLDGPRPYAELPAKHEKSRRGARLPLRDDLAARLASYLDERARRQREAAVRAGDPTAAAIPPDAPLFPNCPTSVRVFDRDLVAAGLATRDKSGKVHKADGQGRVLDVHSLRMTFASMLNAAGTPLTTAMHLMRHTDPRLTAAVYTDVNLLDTAGALASLPTLNAPLEVETQARAEGGEMSPENGAPIWAPNSAPKGQNVAFPGPQVAQRVSDTPPRTEIHNSLYLCGYPHEQGRLEDENDGAPAGTRTQDPRLRRPMLYPAELRARVVSVARFLRWGKGSGGMLWFVQVPVFSRSISRTVFTSSLRSTVICPVLPASR